MHLDVLQQLEVVRGPAHRDAHAGARLGKPAVLEEDPLELPDDDLEHVRPGRERDARDELGHVGVDHLCASAPREGGAVVTVDHEVRLTELDRNDRREGAVGERALERAQPVAAEGVKRAEVAGERAGAAISADERIERDLANAQVPAPERLQSPLDLVEFEQAVAAAGPQSLHHEVKRTTGAARTRPRRRQQVTQLSTPPAAARGGRGWGGGRGRQGGEGEGVGRGRGCWGRIEGGRGGEAEGRRIRGGGKWGGVGGGEGEAGSGGGGVGGGEGGEEKGGRGGRGGWGGGEREE